jgi:hypothetical protein
MIFGCKSNYVTNGSQTDSSKINVANLKNDTLIQYHFPNKLKCDTTVIYDLENISSEGAEVEGCYVNKYLIRAKTSIYGAGGRNDIFYLFNGDTVNVIEKNYIYQKPLEQVKSDADMKFIDSTTYSLSISNRNLIKGKSSNKAVDFLKSFIDKVPLKLK